MKSKLSIIKSVVIIFFILNNILLWFINKNQAIKKCLTSFIFS
jgi:hypothetical protein